MSLRKTLISVIVVAGAGLGLSACVAPGGPGYYYETDTVYGGPYVYGGPAYYSGGYYSGGYYVGGRYYRRHAAWRGHRAWRGGRPGGFHHGPGRPGFAAGHHGGHRGGFHGGAGRAAPWGGGPQN